MSDKNSEKFFKVFFDRMREAQAEIKATVTVNTGEGMSNKAAEEGVTPAKDITNVGRTRRGVFLRHKKCETEWILYVLIRELKGSDEFLNVC